MADPSRDIRLAVDNSRAPRLPTGGGDGHDGGMLENRVAALEVDTKEIKAELKVIGRDVAELKGKVSQLPSLLQIAGLILPTVVATMIGLAGLVYMVARAAK